MQIEQTSQNKIEVEEPHINSEEESVEDLYQQMKQLEEEIEFIDIQENFIKVEQQNLKREALRAKEELKRIQSVPLVIGHFIEMIDEIHGLVNTNSGTTYMVSIWRCWGVF
jgi:26S proteasome regulatory subunit T3